MWRSRGRRMRSRHIGLCCSHPCPVNKGLHVLAAFQETILQHIPSAFVVVTKFYDLEITVAGFRIRIDLMRIRIRIRIQHFF